MSLPVSGVGIGGRGGVYERGGVSLSVSGVGMGGGEYTRGEECPYR